MWLFWMLACGGETQDTGEVEVPVDSADLDGDGVLNEQDCAPEDPERSENLSLTEGPYGPADLAGLCEQYCELTLDNLDLNLDHVSNFDSLSCVVEVQDSLNYNTSDLPNLEQLSQLRRVGGRLDILSSTLTSLKGLDALEETGAIRLYGPKLESLDGLQSLKTAENIRIDVVNVSDLQGLSGLRTSDYIMINDSQLDSLEGIEQMTALNTLELKSTVLGSWQGLPLDAGITWVALSAVEVSSFQEFSAIKDLETLWLSDMSLSEDALAQLPPVESLKLEGISASSLSGIDMSLTVGLDIESCAFGSLGIPLLPEQMSGVSIVENEALQSVDGGAGVAEMDFRLRIKGNEQLVDISGFGDLRAVGLLTIEQNAVLADLSGLYGLESIEGLEIRDNPSLSTAEIAAFIAAVGEQNIGSTLVTDNGE